MAILFGNIFIYFRSSKHVKGFTLVELLIVIAIIGILAVVLVVAVNPSAQLHKAHDAQRKSDLAQIQKALEQYYNDNNQYPNNTSNTFQIIDPNHTPSTIQWGSAWMPYMTVLPSDPNSNTYVYVADPSQQKYWLYASLEQGANDPQACNGGKACVSLSKNGINNQQQCGGICNYGVSSSNTTP